MRPWSRRASGYGTSSEAAPVRRRSGWWSGTTTRYTTQSIFLAILRALSTYDPKKAAFRTWLYRIAANKVIDARRQSRPVTTPLEETELPVQEDFVSQIHDRELLERIESYVSGLSPSLQAVFRLRLYGEQSFGEIAAALGQSEAAVKSQYYRLLGRIREEFGPHG